MEGVAVAVRPRTPSPGFAAVRRGIAVALVLGAIGGARGGELVPIQGPGASRAPVAGMPTLVPIIAAPATPAPGPPPSTTGLPPLRPIALAPAPPAAVRLPQPARPATVAPLSSPIAIGTIPVAPVVVQRPVPTILPNPTAIQRPPVAMVAPPPPVAVRPAPIAAVTPPSVAPVAPAPVAAVAPPRPMAPPPLPAPVTAPPVAAAPPPLASGKPADAVLIASFNIQVFGESKLAKPQVVDVLTHVVRRFDVVAVQEVRAKSDSIVPSFVAAINADGSRYSYVIGPRLGRTVSKEQYTFIYDTTRVEIDPSSVATLPNPGDKLHRPPLRARFRVRTNPPEAGFSFWLVDIHTDPDEVPQEVDALADAFVSMRSVIPDEDDVILLGDLNAGPPQFGRIKQIPGIGWAVSGATTNTRRSKTYDNLIFDRTATTEYTGRWGVLDLQQTFGLPLDKALEVSDHNPVWAAFSPWETQRIAGR
jgi:endonuclease/exonuclease/phosphatase family metal-dependent hydrolase